MKTELGPVEQRLKPSLAVSEQFTYLATDAVLPPLDVPCPLQATQFDSRSLGASGVGSQVLHALPTVAPKPQFEYGSIWTPSLAAHITLPS
jgi:hypothetical protein